MILGDFIVDEQKSWYRDTSYYTVLKYTGENKDVVLPDHTRSIERDAFIGKGITSLSLPAEFRSEDLSGVRGIKTLKKLIFNADDDFRMAPGDITVKFPEVETIEIPAAQKILLSMWDYRQQRLPVLRFTSTKIESIQVSGKPVVNPGKLSLFAPYLSPGKADAEVRCSLIETFLAHPEWYAEDSAKKIQEWIRKNGEKLLPLCQKNGFTDLFNQLIFDRKIKFSLGTYDLLIKCAEQQKDTALMASLLSAKGEHYDLMKITRRKETTDSNDLDNPLRVHAMRKTWSWSSLDDGTLCITKMKKDEADVLDQNTVYLPSAVAEKQVSMIDGPVFALIRARNYIFPEEIRMIRGKIFEKNPTVENVVFRGAVRVIPEKSFLNAYQLCSVTFSGSKQIIGELYEDPDRVTGGGQKTADNDQLLIMAGAFENCSSLKTLSLYRAVLSDEAFCGSGLKKIQLREVLIIPKECFAACMNLTEADIQGTAVIEQEGFSYCSNLQKLHVSEELRAVKQQAFYRCENLRTVYLHNVRNPSMIKKLFQSCSFYKNLAFIPVDEPN